ncbi:MAG: response regulator [Clostridia bacterium]|nr:response regulator [Clostridia bacterium]
MNEKIKILIADDNKAFCELLSKYLISIENIEILGIANSDEAEINMIDNLNPEIVITDLMRNRQYSGLEIIRKYKQKEKSPIFLIISAAERQTIIDENEELNIGGYIKKPFYDYGIIVEELITIKEKYIKPKNI